MLNRKSDYVFNKNNKTAIVYKSVTGPISLHRSDFDSEEEFLKWKDWSDNEYRAEDDITRQFYDRNNLCVEELDLYGAMLSVEDSLVLEIKDVERKLYQVALHSQLKNELTTKQYRRLWLYYIENLSERDIAAFEKCGQQRVSKSIAAGKKKIRKILKNFSI